MPSDIVATFNLWKAGTDTVDGSLSPQTLIVLGTNGWANIQSKSIRKGDGMSILVALEA